MSLYRTKFIKNDYNLPIIIGDTYFDIKKSYTGGSVDMFKPYGENVYEYDVNSLYPSAMKFNPMPTGTPTFFEGDITLLEPNAFGFFEVEVTAPNYLHVPILQTKVQTEKGGTRTISPIGSWTGWYFSEEINNAKRYGYKFQIIKGYLFEKSFIFSEYVDYFYNLKQNSAPNSSNYTIAKLFLVSLYGRLGMSPELEVHDIIDSNNSDIYKDYTVTNVINLGKNKELVSYFTNKTNPNANISIGVASAVTAYGRIHMAMLKMRLLEAGYVIYYSDTDSLFLNKPLDSNLVGDGLGLMKLVNIYKEAVFLCPKVRGGINQDGKEIVKVKGVKDTIQHSDLKLYWQKTVVLLKIIMLTLLIKSTF
uniref:hypothetical protein n=1 Tax=Porodaedalea mongolica TaxID=2651638 RepID=UPI0021AC0FBE|nr:hypothetical protein NYK79_mgp47 [Porodaedalea mongolica]UUA03943.1 hypothetical protein [Porodaedalea mongolica]WCF76703.1 hypothetical protein [Porodaedalea mongolica]